MGYHNGGEEGYKLRDLTVDRIGVELESYMEKEDLF